MKRLSRNTEEIVMISSIGIRMPGMKTDFRRTEEPLLIAMTKELIAFFFNFRFMFAIF